MSECGLYSELSQAGSSAKYFYVICISAETLLLQRGDSRLYKMKYSPVFSKSSCFLFYIQGNYHDQKLHSLFTIAYLFPISLFTVPEPKFHEGIDFVYLVYCSSLASRIQWTLNKHLLRE